MTTVAEIAAEAFSAVALEITDAIHAATMTGPNSGTYNPATDAFGTAGTPATGRAVVASDRPIADIFPDYVAGPNDELVLLEGFSACREGMALTFGGHDRIVRQVQDIAGAGALFYIVARKTP